MYIFHLFCVSFIVSEEREREILNVKEEKRPSEIGFSHMSLSGCGLGCHIQIKPTSMYHIQYFYSCTLTGCLE